MKNQSSCCHPEDSIKMASSERAPTADEAMGMAWWNSMSEGDRSVWAAKAGNTGIVADAWETFKTGKSNTRTTIFPARPGLFPAVSFRSTEDARDYIATELRDAACGLCTCPAGSYSTHRPNTGGEF